jgi:hypothetical protein
LVMVVVDVLLVEVAACDARVLLAVLAVKGG